MYNSDNTVQFETSNLACQSFSLGSFETQGRTLVIHKNCGLPPVADLRGKAQVANVPRSLFFPGEMKRWFTKNELSVVVQKKKYRGWIMI